MRCCHVPAASCRRRQCSALRCRAPYEAEVLAGLNSRGPKGLKSFAVLGFSSLFLETAELLDVTQTSYDSHRFVVDST
jgi:hypothetical protein